MASKVKKQVQEELLNTMTLLQEAGQDNSVQFNLLEGLYNKINEFDDDKDIVNTIWANKDLPLRMFTTPDLEMMPSFNALLIGEPYKDKVDKDKYFGKDWYKDITEIPYNKIALVAAKEGRSTETLLKEMTDEAIQRNRYDIAHEGALGAVMPFVAKRTQEAIERGEEPSGTDYALDFLQTGLEATPYGRAARAINNPAARFLVGRVLSNTTAPLLTEVADVAAYDTTNTRGKFNLQDVMAGAGTNVMGESFLRLGGGFLNRVGAQDVGKRIMNLGEGETLTQSLAHDIRQINKLEAKNDLLMKRNAKGEALSTNTAGSNKQRIDAMAYEQKRDALENRKQILEELDYRYNSNKARDKVYGKGNHPDKPSNLQGSDYTTDPMLDAMTDEQLKTMANDEILRKYINLDLGSWPTEARYMNEESIKNLLTNKLGSYQQEQGRAFTRIPFGIGAKIQKAIDERNEEEARREEEERIYNMYKLNLLGGN